jgi:hypothetical protein
MMAEANTATPETLKGTTAELGRLWMDLFNEQSRHNLEVMTALGRAVRWDELLEIQAGFFHVSLERWSQLNGRWLEIVRTATPAPTAEEQAQEAA